MIQLCDSVLLNLQIAVNCKIYNLKLIIVVITFLSYVDVVTLKFCPKYTAICNNILLATSEIGTPIQLAMQGMDSSFTFYCSLLKL